MNPRLFAELADEDSGVVQLTAEVPQNPDQIQLLEGTVRMPLDEDLGGRLKLAVHRPREPL
jgi:hypothetical protein